MDWVNLFVGCILFVLGSILVTLRALGVKDFQKLVDKLSGFGKSSTRFLKRVYETAFPPILVFGGLVGLAWPSICIGTFLTTGYELPLGQYYVRFFFFYLQLVIEHSPPSTAWDWVVLIAPSGLSFVIFVVAAVILLLLIGAEISLLSALREGKETSNIRKATLIGGLTIVSPTALAFALFVILYLLGGIVLVILALALLIAMGAGCSIVVFLVALAPIKFTALLAGRLAKHNVERLAAITGIMLLLLSTLLFTGVIRLTS